MNPFLAIARGIRAASSSGSLIALGWIYGVLAALAAILTLVVYTVVSMGVARSGIAGQLRTGLSTDWLIDTFAQPGSGSKVVALALLALVLAIVYAVASVALSGGVVARICGALGGEAGRREPFLAACGRHAGPMLRVAVIECLFLGFVGGLVAVVWTVGMAGGAGNVFAWAAVAVMALVISTFTGLADVARVHVVATGDRSAVAAWRDAFSHSARRAPAFVVLVAFNLVIAGVIAWIALTMHGTISRETGFGVVAALVVGQIGVAGRIWARIVALATQASLRRLAG